VGGGFSFLLPLDFLRRSRVTSAVILSPAHATLQQPHTDSSSSAAQEPASEDAVAVGGAAGSSPERLRASGSLTTVGTNASREQLEDTGGYYTAPDVRGGGGAGSSPSRPPAGAAPAVEPNVCVACRRLVQLETPSVLTCGHRLHRTCADNLVRTSRRPPRDLVAPNPENAPAICVYCPSCDRPTSVLSLPEFLRVDVRCGPLEGGVSGGLEGHLLRCRRAGVDPAVLETLVDDITRRSLPPFVAHPLWVDFVRTMRDHLAVRGLTPPFPRGEATEAAALGDFRRRMRQWASECERVAGFRRRVRQWASECDRVAGDGDAISSSLSLPSLPWEGTGRWDTPDEVPEVRVVDTLGGEEEDLEPCTVSTMFRIQPCFCAFLLSFWLFLFFAVVGTRQSWPFSSTHSAVHLMLPVIHSTLICFLPSQAVEARLQQVLFLLQCQSSPPPEDGGSGGGTPQVGSRDEWGRRRHRMRLCRICQRGLPGRGACDLPCAHSFHVACVEDLVRNSRFCPEPGAPAALACPSCGDRTNVCDINDLYSVACLPLPRIARQAGRRLESLTEYATRVRNGGSAVLAALEADINRVAFPPFVPGPLWARLVRYYRQRAVDLSVHRGGMVNVIGEDFPRGEDRAYARCTDPSEGISSWAAAVDGLPAGTAIPPFPYQVHTARAPAEGAVGASTVVAGGEGTGPAGLQNEAGGEGGATESEREVGGRAGDGGEAPAPAADARPSAEGAAPPAAGASGPAGTVVESCALCDCPLGSSEPVVRLPCVEVGPGHVFHRRCVEADARARRSVQEGRAHVRCCLCSTAVAVNDVMGLDMVAALPAPLQQEGVCEYIRRTGDNHQGILSFLRLDMLGLSYPPFVVPAGWSELVSTCRRNGPGIEDSVAVTHPLVTRALSRWALAVENGPSRGPIGPFPWPREREGIDTYYEDAPARGGAAIALGEGARGRYGYTVRPLCIVCLFFSFSFRSVQTGGLSFNGGLVAPRNNPRKALPFAHFLVLTCSVFRFLSFCLPL